MDIKLRFIILKVVLINFLIAFIWGILMTGVLAIGQLTAPIEIDNALRGQKIEQIMTLYNTEDREILFGLVTDNEIKLWAKFYKLDDPDNEINEIRLDAKERRGVRVIFTVPDDTPNGEYTGYVSVFTKPDEQAATGTVSMVEQKVPRPATIQVTDIEEIDFTTAVIAQREAVLGEPLKVRIAYDNSGNTVIRPQIQVRASQQDNVFYNAILPYPENEDGVKPLERREIKPIEIQTNGAVLGMARAVVTTIYNGKEMEETTIRFAINEKSLLADSSLVNLNNKKSLIFGGSGLLLLAMALFAGVIIKRRKKTSKTSNSKKRNGTGKKSNGVKRTNGIKRTNGAKRANGNRTNGAKKVK